MQRTTTITVGLIGILTLGLASSASAATTPSTSRVSVHTDGTQADGESRHAAISADGRYIAFSSRASNLVPGDTNDAYDVFLHDTTTGTTTRISVASDGTEGDGDSDYPSISADGRYITFDSLASNLVPDDTNDAYDVFLHDTTTGTTTRISVASDGTEGRSDSFSPTISADGRHIAFSSHASNLDPDDTNDEMDVFVHDTTDGTTTRVSVASDGTQGNGESGRSSISADGRYIAFSSHASNLVPDDTNLSSDVFLHDTLDGTTTRISVASDGTEGNTDSVSPVISADGRHIAFSSHASTLVSGDTNNSFDVFVYDTLDATTTRVSVASDGTQSDNDSFSTAISADGRHIAFFSDAANLVSGDTNGVPDVFVHDTTDGTTTRVSVAGDGTQGDGESTFSSISADGRHIAFMSLAGNLVPDDTNESSDVFLYGIDAAASAPNPELAATGHEAGALTVMALAALALGAGLFAASSSRRARNV